MDGLWPLMGFEFAVISQEKKKQSWHPGGRLLCFEESAKVERSSIVWIQLNKDIKDEHPVLDLDLIFLTGEERTDNYGFLHIMAQEAGVIFGANETASVSVLPEQFPDRRYGTNEANGSREHSC